MKETTDQLNQLGLDKIQEITKAGHFETIRICDEFIAQHQDSKDLDFYFKQQRELNEACGEILVEYYTLKAKLKTYIAVSKTNKRLSAAAAGSKIPSDVSLADEVVAEVNELNIATIILEGWCLRAESSIKTCRSHTYTGGSDRSESMVSRDNE